MQGTRKTCEEADLFCQNLNIKTGPGWPPAGRELSGQAGQNQAVGKHAEKLREKWERGKTDSDV